MNHSRVVWVDSGKGIGIFLVVLGHALRGLHASGIIAESPAYELADGWIYSFHMPFFFFLSGLFAERQIGRSPGTFLKDKLKTIAYPYFIWSFLQVLSQMATSRYANYKPSLSELSEILVVPIQQFWFLYTLFLISLIYFGLRRCGLSPFAAFLVLAAFCATNGWLSLGWYGPLYLARRFGIYLALGSVLNAYGWIERAARASAGTLLATAVTGYGLVTVAVTVGRPWSTTMYTSVPLPLTIAVALCGVAASLSLGIFLSRVPILSFVGMLGLNSLEIYVAHTIASGGVRIVLQKILHIQNVTIHILVGVVAGFVLPLGLMWASRKYHFEILFRLKPCRGPRPSVEATASGVG